MLLICLKICTNFWTYQYNFFFFFFPLWHFASVYVWVPADPVPRPWREEGRRKCAVGHPAKTHARSLKHTMVMTPNIRGTELVQHHLIFDPYQNDNCHSKKQTVCHFKDEDIWFYPWVSCSRKLIVAVNYTFQNLLMESPTYMAFF